MNQKSNPQENIKNLKNYNSLSQQEKLELEYTINTDWETESKVNLNRKNRRIALINAYTNIMQEAA